MWRPPNLSELTPYQISSGLTRLGSEALHFDALRISTFNWRMRFFCASVLGFERQWWRCGRFEARSFSNIEFERKFQLFDVRRRRQIFHDVRRIFYESGSTVGQVIVLFFIYVKYLSSRSEMKEVIACGGVGWIIITLTCRCRDRFREVRSGWRLKTFYFWVFLCVFLCVSE